MPLVSSACVALLALVAGARSAGLKEEFTWTTINYAWPQNYTGCGEELDASGTEEFVFPTDDKKGMHGSYGRGRRQTGSPEYIGENNIPMGATRYKNQIFVTVPRRRVGIPSTLNVVSLNCKQRHNVPLTPFPNWEINDLNGARPSDPSDVHTPLVSVYRTTVDACDRLWFVDMGILEYPTGRQQVQPMALVIMDLKTNKIIKRHPFGEDVVNAGSTLASVTVDVTRSTCDDAYAYMGDLVNYDLAVYSLKQDDSWAVHHNYFYLQPTGGDFRIGGYSFQWNDGVFSVALAKPSKDGYRTAYFHAMASTQEFAVSTRLLRNRTLATRGYHGEDFRAIGDRLRDGQSANHEIHQESGVMFLAEVNRHAVACWPIGVPLTPENHGIVQQDYDKMIYPSDLKIDGNDVWVMTNSMPVFLYGTLDYSRTNFRIWSSSVKNAIAGTVCDKRKH